MTARIEPLATSGTFQLHGGNWEVGNNVWLIDDDELLVIEAAHDADAIAAAVGSRRMVTIVRTHAHNDRVNATPALAARYGAPICSTRPTPCCGRECKARGCPLLRLEKGYRSWGHDMTTDHNPYEAGLDFRTAHQGALHRQVRDRGHRRRDGHPPAHPSGHPGPAVRRDGA